MLTIASRLDVMNRLGRALADPTRSRIIWCCCNLGREPRKLRFYCVINAMCLCCQAVSNTR
ncbi:MAG: hypothetical protein E7K06_08660, partial [Corynebacterium sp.]|nr:hypothetical protein [Corynebacterium sp.]MDU4408037.1 hypothetical protein [Corynebacterium sp.]MDU5328538.1 hypothetical protein [Corynebacterium sp.]MDU6417722.1 hypothetical protein [Corynebacterium sp.]MDU6592743.1 hypothetical protein [Corynebacterium sp.]